MCAFALERSTYLPLQALDRYGCAAKLVDLGIKGSSWKITSRDSDILKIHFSSNSPYTKFPFVLILAQTATEYVLEQRLNELGVRVLRPYHVIGMKNNALGNGMDVLFESGEVVRTNYIVGADGARSTVRILNYVSRVSLDNLLAGPTVIRYRLCGPRRATL